MVSLVLVSLFFWNLLLYPFTKLPKMWALGVSCGLAVMIGYLDFISSTLSLSRTFVFLPMFLVGFYLKNSTLIYFGLKGQADCRGRTGDCFPLMLVH